MTSTSVNIANRSASARQTASTASYSSGSSASRSTADSARNGIRLRPSFLLVLQCDFVIWFDDLGEVGSQACCGGGAGWTDARLS